MCYSPFAQIGDVLCNLRDRLVVGTYRSIHVSQFIVDVAAENILTSETGNIHVQLKKISGHFRGRFFFTETSLNSGEI